MFFVIVAQHRAGRQVGCLCAQLVRPWRSVLRVAVQWSWLHVIPLKYVLRTGDMQLGQCIPKVL